jgi:hypothetical protein
MYYSLRSVIQCACELSQIISGFFTSKNGTAAEFMHGEEIPEESTHSMLVMKINTCIHILFRSIAVLFDSLLIFLENCYHFKATIE